jgi:hypothetical protein
MLAVDCRLDVPSVELPEPEYEVDEIAADFAAVIVTLPEEGLEVRVELRGPRFGFARAELHGWGGGYWIESWESVTYSVWRDGEQLDWVSEDGWLPYCETLVESDVIAKMEFWL